jgi:hypothetical protein
VNRFFDQSQVVTIIGFYIHKNASYGSQGHGGGIRPCLLTGLHNTRFSVLVIYLQHGPYGKPSFILVEACLQSSCLATSLGAYHHNNGLHIYVTCLRGKVFTSRCIATAVLLFVSCVRCRENVYGVVFIETCCITPLFCCCVRVFLSNGCFCGFTVLAWSKYVTLLSIRPSPLPSKSLYFDFV